MNYGINKRNWMLWYDSKRLFIKLVHLVWISALTLNMNFSFLERKKEEEIEYRELNIGLIEYRKVKGVVRIFQVNYELWVCLVRDWMHCGKYHVRWFEEMVFESSSR